MTTIGADGQALIDGLRVLAARGLAEMVNERTGLFPHKVVLTDGAVEPRGENPFYSAISLIGLLCSDVEEVWEGRVSLGRAIDAVVREARRSSDAALIGTTIWLLALASDARAAAVLADLERRWTGADRPTTEIAFVVSGAVAAMERLPACRDRAGRLAATGVRLLTERWVASAQLFGGQRGWRPRALVARNLTSFANQVYPLHALGRHALVALDEIPACAVRTAERLVAQQGSLGQWWWLYCARDGTVVDGYPVYSVHQDGMAFLGLAPLDQGGRYANALWRGLLWVDGANELGRSLVDRERNLVVRCIQRVGSHADAPSGMSRRALAAAQLASWGVGRPVGPRAEPSRLEILYECRPYHLGWLLYAWSLARSRGS